MKNIKSVYIIVIFTILISWGIRFVCYANAAEPPSIIIIVPNAPDDLKISIETDGKSYDGRVHDKVIEKYYTFYRYDI